MDANDPLIITLKAKYALREPLTAKEWRTLEDWCKASPDNMEFAIQFGDEQWVRDVINKLNSTPVGEMWAMITRDLDAMDAAVNGFRNLPR